MFGDALAIGPSILRKVEGMPSGLCMAFMAVSGSRMVKDGHLYSAAVDNCSAFFRWRA